MDFTAARQHMILSQVRPSKVKDETLIQALSDLPRELFVPESHRAMSYIDRPVPLNAERFMTEPMVLARLLQASEPKMQDRALVVAGGLGYAAAILSRLTKSVTAIESDPALAARARETLSRVGIVNATIVEGPLDAGAPGKVTFDVILIDGAVELVPDAILAQLADGGRLVTVLMDRGIGRGALFDKVGGVLSHRTLFDAGSALLPGFSQPAKFRF